MKHESFKNLDSGFQKAFWKKVQAESPFSQALWLYSWELYFILYPSYFF